MTGTTELTELENTERPGRRTGPDRRSQVLRTAIAQFARTGLRGTTRCPRTRAGRKRLGTNSVRTLRQQEFVPGGGRKHNIRTHLGQAAGEPARYLLGMKPQHLPFGESRRRP